MLSDSDYDEASSVFKDGSTEEMKEVFEAVLHTLDREALKFWLRMINVTPALGTLIFSLKILAGP
jgi:hypothetical protein